MEGAPGKPHGLVMVLGFACGSFASVGREASQEAGQACFWCPEAESNHRHEDFQSSALPTELSGHVLYLGNDFNIIKKYFLNKSRNKLVGLQGLEPGTYRL